MTKPFLGMCWTKTRNYTFHCAVQIAESIKKKKKKKKFDESERGNA